MTIGRGTLALVSLLAAVGCSSVDTTEVQSDQPIRLGSSAGGAWAGADWILIRAAIENDTLAVELQYSGGCALHDFWVVVDGFVDVPDEGPTPTVAVPLRIAHDDRGDACEAALVEPLRFGLAPLRDAYRAARGAGPARLLLRVPVRQGATEVVVLDWTI